MSRETIYKAPEPINAANCDCIEEQQATFKEGFHLPVSRFGGQDGVQYTNLLIHVKRNGSRVKEYVMAEFCPFCGTKYKSRDEIKALYEAQKA